MGEIAEMVLNGDMCENCGEYLGGGPGYPVKCPTCAREEPPRKKRKKKSK